MYTAPVSRASILIVNDDKRVRKSLQRILNDAKHLHFAADAPQAFNRLQRHATDLVFLNIVLPDMSGIELLKRLKQIKPHTPVIMATTAEDIQAAVDAMKAGAFDFLTAPFDVDHVRSLARQALGHPYNRLPVRCPQVVGTIAEPESIVGNIQRIIDSLSPCESHVLIQGASSTLRRLTARAMHAHSTRGDRPYLSLNCAVMPARRVERDLFGPGCGNTAGTLTTRSGKIERAHTGILFLDNINYLSMESQARLLHIIQHKAFERPGCHHAIKADIRFIAATEQNLEALVDAGLFRADLYDQLNTLPVDLPLLCARGGDLGMLLEHCLRQRNLRKGASAPRTESIPKACDWPGNVRAFEHLLERLFTIHQAGVENSRRVPERRTHVDPYPFKGLRLKKATRAFERQHIMAVLKAFDGHRSQAARHLGIHRNTLLMKTKELGIDFR